MEFGEKIKSLGVRIQSLKDNIHTEEATKTSLVMPFFQALGYDIFNPKEFTPEFTADVGIKKGEKVDYAIQLDDEVIILVECKSVNENLEKHDSQLFRYFGTSNAKFAILTNGIIYRFYTDIEEANKMDEAPFLEVDLSIIKDHQISELQKFTKENFNKDKIFDSAAELKYMNQIREILKEIVLNPSEDMVRLILNRGVYEGVKTQSIVDKFQPLVKKSFSLFISEMINDRLKSALKSDQEKVEELSETSGDPIIDNNIEDKIITTQEELDTFYIVKSIIRNIVDPNRITYKDTESYFSINIDNKVTKWVCRIYIKERTKYIIIPNNTDRVRYDLESLDDIYALADFIILRTTEIM